MEGASRSVFGNIWVKVKSFASHRTIGGNSASVQFALLDVCLYLLFLTATTNVMMSTRGTDMFLFKKTMERHFVERVFYNEHGSELTFNNLVTVADWWSYIDTTFIENLAQFNRNDERSNGNWIENHAVLGEPRLRQIRVRNETCSIDDAFRGQFRTCYGRYSKHNEDASGFFNTTQQTHESIKSVWGKITTYNGPGYIVNLSLDADYNESVVSQLKAKSWIDRATRIILIEFMTFNSNVNLLCNIKLIAELTPSGGILTSGSIQTLRYFLLSEGFLKWFYASVFYALILFQTFEYTLAWHKIGPRCMFFSVWNFLDVIVILLGYLSLFYIIWHTKFMEGIVDTDILAVDHLDDICYWNMFFNTAIGVCVFSTWIKILKYIQFNKTMFRFNKTIQKCAEDVLSFCLMLAIVLIAYAELSVLLFGTSHAEFRDFSTAMLTMTRMVLGDLSYSEMEDANPILGPIYFLSYILFVFFILMNMFLAIIVDTYSEVAAEGTDGNYNFYHQYFENMIKKLKSRSSKNSSTAPIPSKFA